MGIYRLLILVCALAVMAGDTVSNQNYASGRTLPVWADGQVYVSCNFSQLEPHTVIGGDKRVEFIRCNVKNCDAGSNAVFTGCYQVGNYTDYCAWLHPEWALDGEPDSCLHLDSITVYIDGVDTVSIEYYRSDTAVK